MALQNEIDAKRATIHTDGYPMSIGELANLYRDGELDIHPEFQRFFRWSDWQKSRLIESILLGLPIPSIFVSQQKGGVWDVIDGLQRLSTIFATMGILKTPDGLAPPFALTGTDYLPSLAGKTWNDDEEEDPRYFSQEQKLLIKRAKLDVKIVLRESDESSKYELFQRLNTGGSTLSDQELRNCILIMLNPDFYRWIVQLREDEAFQNCLSLTDRAVDEQYDLELVVRFLVFRLLPEDEFRKIGDMGDFLTKRVMKQAQEDNHVDRDQHEAAFKATFGYLSGILASDSFRKYTAERFVGGFLISGFEAIALGIGFNHAAYEEGTVGAEQGRDKIMRLWSTAVFTQNSGAGIRASTRVSKIIPLARAHFAP